MILFMARLIKLFLVVLILFFGYRIFSKRLEKKYLAYLGVVIIVFAFCANYIANLLPPLTDTITLTALGEKQEEAKGMEVYLNGYTVDGEEFLAGKSLKIESGHWFWSGETYAWRPETDSRQPDGVTRTVVLKIPVGWDRSLNFAGGVWRGLVEVDDGHDVWIEDTFTEDNSVKTVKIGRSSTLDLITNQIRCLAIYAFTLFALFAVVMYIAQKVLANLYMAKKWLYVHNGRLCYASIAFFTFIIMFHYADRVSFWSDELAQVGFVNGSLADVLEHCLTFQEGSPPFALFCSWIWYHIAPYGERWTLLLGIILTIFSIYLIGVIGEKIKGKYCGFFACVFMATSLTVWQNVAYEFRAYPYMLFFSTLTMLLYINRNNVSTINKTTLFYALSITALSMTHYFGMIACACYFVADLYLLYKRQIQFKTILCSYLLPGIIGSLWLFSVIVAAKSIIDNGLWYPIPKFEHIRILLHFLSGYCDLVYYLLILGIAFSLLLLFIKKEKFIWNMYYQKFFCLMMIWAILIVILYGNFVNTNSTLWQVRYFIFLIPVVCLFAGLGADNICSLFQDNVIDLKKSICIFITFVLFLNCIISVSNFKSKYPFREAADWIYTQSNYIFNEDTIILKASNWGGEGWEEYYITRQGRREPIKVFVQHALTKSEESITPEEILNYSKIYVQYSNDTIRPRLQTVLDDNYILEVDKTDIQVKVYNRK